VAWINLKLLILNTIGTVKITMPRTTPMSVAIHPPIFFHIALLVTV